MTENQCVFTQCNSQQQAIDLILNEFDKPIVKTCPFCGGGHRCISGHGLFRVECRECYVKMVSDISLEDVILKWNRRDNAK